MTTLSGSLQTLTDGITVNIRSATPQDAAETLSIFRSVVEEGLYTMAEPDEIDTTVADSQSEIITAQKHPGNLYLVAEIEGKVVGTVRAESGSYRRTRHFAEIDSMWVRPHWRGRGVSNLLLDSLLDWAKQHPLLEKLGLFVFSTNTRAISFYEKHGFVVEGQYSQDVKFSEGNYVDTIAMGQLIKSRI